MFSNHCVVISAQISCSEKQDGAQMSGQTLDELYGMDCTVGASVVDIIAIVVLSISVCVMTATGIFAYTKMRSQKMLNRPLACLFWMAVISYCCVCIMYIAVLALCMSGSNAARVLFALCMLFSPILFVSLLGTLLLRLSVTFDDSHTE